MTWGGFSRAEQKVCNLPLIFSRYPSADPRGTYPADVQAPNVKYLSQGPDKFPVAPVMPPPLSVQGLHISFGKRIRPRLRAQRRAAGRKPSLWRDLDPSKTESSPRSVLRPPGTSSDVMKGSSLRPRSWAGRTGSHRSDSSRTHLSARIIPAICLTTIGRPACISCAWRTQTPFDMHRTGPYPSCSCW
jgi:hypothetical protein